MKKVLSLEKLQTLVHHKSNSLFKPNDHTKKNIKEFQRSLYENAVDIVTEVCPLIKGTNNLVIENENFEETVLLTIVCLTYQLMTVFCSNEEQLSKKYENNDLRLKLFIKNVLDNDRLSLNLLEALNFLKPGFAEQLLGVLAYMYSDTHFLGIFLSLDLNLDKECISILKDEKFKDDIINYAKMHKDSQDERKDINLCMMREAALNNKRLANAKCILMTGAQLKSIEKEIALQTKKVEKDKVIVLRHQKELEFNGKFHFELPPKRSEQYANDLVEYQNKCYDLQNKRDEYRELLYVKNLLYKQNITLIDEDRELKKKVKAA